MVRVADAVLTGSQAHIIWEIRRIVAELVSYWQLDSQRAINIGWLLVKFVCIPS